MKKIYQTNKKYFFSKFIKGVFGRGSTTIKSDPRQEGTYSDMNNIDVESDSLSENSNVLSDLKNKKELALAKENELKKVYEKYELYKNYEPVELLKKDPEFGQVVKYDDFLEEGKEKFEGLITKYMEENRELENNKDYKTLLKVVEEKTKMFYSNYKEEYKYNLQPYEERWYKEAIYSRKKNELDMMVLKKEDPMKKRAPQILNRKKQAMELENLAVEPNHPSFPSMFKTPFESYIDSYNWLSNIHSEETKVFIKSELLYSQRSLFKYKTQEEIIFEEFLDNPMISPPCALQLSNNLILFKRNKSDISLYTVPNSSIEPEKRGIIDIEDLKTRGVDIKEIFGLKDFIELNQRFTDLTFLDFAKRLLDEIELERDILVDFALCPNEQFLIMFFDMKGDMRGLDVLIKDIKNDVLLPVVIYNTYGNVAFDHCGGFYYTQLDITGRPAKVFRHQIGRPHRSDIQIYNERNKEFKVKTYNCNSKEMVYIEVSTNNTEGNGIEVNEVWFKQGHDVDKVDFTCLKKMEKNINYAIKYSNGAFYMLINKSDTYDKTLKRLRVNNSKIFGLLEASKTVSKSSEAKNKSKPSQTNEKETLLTPLSQVKDLEVQKKEDKEKVVDLFQEATVTQSQQDLVPVIQDLIKLEDYINIIDFEIFKNHLVVLEEVEQQRRFKIFNLITNEFYLHQPELELMSIKLADNLAYESDYFRYIQSSPVEPHYTIDFSMGTRKAYTVHTNNYKKYDSSKFKVEVVYMDDRDKEIKIPVVLAYKEETYNASSPFILYTKGALSSKSDLEFNDLSVSLMNRGFVLAYPQVRGTKFFDFSWYSSGIADHKLHHFTDFLDVAETLKERSMTEKIILYGDGYSGGLTAAVSFLQYPNFFDSVVTYNSAFDVMDLCMNNSGDIGIIEEFGDINVKQYYELMKLYSPYHLKTPSFHCPLFITSDDKSPYLHHSLKFIAKMRKKNKAENNENKIYFELLSNKPTEEEKNAFIFSSIVGNTYLS